MARRVKLTSDPAEAERLAEGRRQYRLRRIPKWEEEIRLSEQEGNIRRALQLKHWLHEDRVALAEISAADHLSSAPAQS